MAPLLHTAAINSRIPVQRADSILLQWKYTMLHVLYIVISMVIKFQFSINDFIGHLASSICQY